MQFDYVLGCLGVVRDYVLRVLLDVRVFGVVMFLGVVGELWL